MIKTEFGMKLGKKLTAANVSKRKKIIATRPVDPKHCQIFDSENQQKENKVHKQIFGFMHTTTKQEEGGAFPGDYNHFSVVSCNVKSPSPAGRHPLEELFLERPKIQILARDEPSAIAVLGQTCFDELITKGVTHVCPSLDVSAEEEPNQAAIEDRSRRAVRSSEETGQGVPTERLYDEDFF
jgi:hypothetical protein